MISSCRTQVLIHKIHKIRKTQIITSPISLPAQPLRVTASSQWSCGGVWGPYTSVMTPARQSLTFGWREIVVTCTPSSLWHLFFRMAPATWIARPSPSMALTIQENRSYHVFHEKFQPIGLFQLGQSRENMFICAYVSYNKFSTKWLSPEMPIVFFIVMVVLKKCDCCPTKLGSRYP